MAVQLPKSLREYANGLQSLVAFLAEARIRQLAAEKVDFFVEGLEAGVNDCAIYAGPGTLQNRGGAAHTLFVQLPSHRGEKVFGPLDLKLCTARSDSKKGIQFAIHINPGQRLSCQAIIIVSPKEPDFAILVPLIYLPERNSEIRETVVLSSFRPLWTLYPLPAFPPEYTPFIFPLAWVQSALEDMQAYFNRSSDLWGNEYTGVNFTGAPPPQLFDESVLQPAQGSQSNAVAQVRRIFLAFHKYSEQFRVDLVGVRPFMGDLKIIETSTEQEVFLELKDNFFEIVEDEKSGLAVLRHKQTNQGLRKIFSWKSQWDYLLTANWTKRIAYILPRDKIPADWWNASVSKEHELKMLEGFEECFVDLRRDDQMVRDIEKVLNTTRTRTGSMRAQNAISIDHSTHEPFDEIEDDLGSDGFDLVSRQRWSTSGFRRGFGSAKHSELRGETYAVWVSEVLIELCRASGQGLILDFGFYNPICRYAIARYLWSEVEKLRHDRDGEPPCRVYHLPKNTPVVPLSFLGTDWTGGWQPRGNRNFISGLEDIAERPRSLVVLDLYPESCLRLRHGRFVCASEHLKPRLSRNMRGVLKKGLLDQYYVDSSDLIDVMTAPLRGESQVALGHPETTIQAADYCHTIQDLHQAGVDSFAQAMKSKLDRAPS